MRDKPCRRIELVAEREHSRARLVELRRLLAASPSDEAALLVALNSEAARLVQLTRDCEAEFQSDLCALGIAPT